MITALVRRAAAAIVVAAIALMTVGGLVVPANAAGEYWIESYSDHTDIVVDWWAVDDVVAEPAILSPACSSMVSDYHFAWVVADVVACLAWADECLRTANSIPLFRDHGVRISYRSDGRTCSIIGEV